MNIDRRHFSLALVSSAGASLTASFAGNALAQGAPVEGKDFKRIDAPQAPGVPAGKVEVLEFFSYACPHCSVFEPVIEAWQKQLPGDVVVRRVPVPFLMNAENFMHTYYALESMGAVPAMQMKIFRAIHVDRQRLDTPENIAAFIGKSGGDAAKFQATFKSFSVATSVSRAKKMMADYKIDSVPTLVVHGRWMTSPSMAGSSERALAVVDQLVARARKG